MHDRSDTELSELRVLVEHLRRENVRLSDTIKVSATAKIIADEAKAQAAETKQRFDNAQAFAACEKVVADEAKAIRSRGENHR